MKFKFGDKVQIVSDSQAFYKGSNGIVIEYHTKHGFGVYVILLQPYNIKVTFAEDVLAPHG
ncbi:MAG: hypothetical protein KDB74_01550 [Flavobacteriales bacterium]|nr:hypothetical protein [Flavobacteriales bacterium]